MITIILAYYHYNHYALRCTHSTSYCLLIAMTSAKPTGAKSQIVFLEFSLFRFPVLLVMMNHAKIFALNSAIRIEFEYTEVITATYSIRSASASKNENVCRRTTKWKLRTRQRTLNWKHNRNRGRGLFSFSFFSIHTFPWWKEIELSKRNEKTENELDQLDLSHYLINLYGFAFAYWFRIRFICHRASVIFGRVCRDRTPPAYQPRTFGWCHAGITNWKMIQIHGQLWLTDWTHWRKPTSLFIFFFSVVVFTICYYFSTKIQFDFRCLVGAQFGEK